MLFHNVQKGFIVQTGDPTGTGKGGSSVYGCADCAFAMPCRLLHGQRRMYGTLTFCDAFGGCNSYVTRIYTGTYTAQEQTKWESRCFTNFKVSQ